MNKLRMPHGRPDVKRWLAGQGARRVLLCLGHKADLVRKHLADAVRPQPEVEVMVEAKPLGTAGAVAALTVMLCLLAFNRAGSQGVIGALSRIALVMVGAGVSLVALASHSDVAAERRVLDARVHELLTRAGSMPGSALACLDAMAGDTVESACERALFQTPEATAAAVSYTSAQLTLLADLTMHVRRSNAPDEPAALGNLRRAIERDRFGLVAHVLAIRDGCTPDACVAFVLLDNTSRIRNNLAERTYDVYVVRHSALWSDTDKLPVATVAPRAAPAAPATAGMGAGLFPSAESIPPVNIIDPESRAPAKFGSTPASSATRQVPMPRPRPVRLASAPIAGRLLRLLVPDSVMCEGRHGEFQRPRRGGDRREQLVRTGTRRSRARSGRRF